MSSESESTSVRVKTFSRNENLEMLLGELNGSLASSDAVLDINSNEVFSKIFVVGAFRSGTTLFTQWLSSSGLVAYPTNMLSRFYGAPYTGAKIQQILTDPKYNFRNEILDFNSPIEFSSENGKTTGALAPNEFWYFWRRFLPFSDLDYIPDLELRTGGNLTGLRDELNGLANIFKKPFALKAMILNQNLVPLNEQFQKAVFVWVKRDPVYNIQSALLARMKQFGNFNTWYSFKIKEHPQLVDLDPLHSVAGQIAATNIALEKAQLVIPKEKWINVSYENFCEQPKYFFDELVDLIDTQGGAGNLPPAYSGIDAFESTNSWKLSEYSLPDAERAYAVMYNKIKDTPSLGL